MSVAATVWAWQQPVNGNAKLVLLALADECRDEDGLCWPGLKTVARKAGLDERSVRRQVATLEEKGLLERRERTRDDGSQTSNLIALNLHAKLPSPPDTGVRGSPDTGVRPRAVKQEPETPQTPPKTPSKRILSPAEESVTFSEWLGYHCMKAERTVPRAGTSARSELARTYAALELEGYSLEDFKLASDGVLGDEFMVREGHTKPENVLRKSKIAGRIDDGRRLAAKGRSRFEAFDDVDPRFGGAAA